MTIRELISYNLERIRTAKGLTKTDLANLCGYTRKHIGNVELGHVYPKEECLLAIARALEIDVSELVVAPDYRERKIQAVYEAFQTLNDKIDKEMKEQKDAQLKELLEEKL